MRHLPPELSLFIATPKALHLRSQSITKTLFECERADSIVNARVSKSVQAYSIPTAQLLSSLPPHPSPPNTIVQSGDGSILLSASATPPTIHLQDRRWGGSAPVNFQPTGARSPVSCAAFQTFDPTAQPSCAKFVLGFQDGSLAMYRLLMPSLLKHHRRPHRPQTLSFQLHPVRVGAIKKLHKAAMGGIVAAEFIPGYNSRTVSVGHDGRCRLHVSGPATCVSVTANTRTASDGNNDRTVLLGGDATDDANQVSEGSEIFIAIGTEAGKVLVFNILGLLIHEVTMSMRVINLGWVVNRSVCSTLSNRNSCSVRDESLKHPEASCTEDTDTVKRATSPCKQVGIQKLFPLASTGDLFSNEPSRHITTMPAGTLSDISLLRPKHSPTPVKRKSLVRPRIVKETFKSPIASSSPLFMSARAVLPSELPAPRLQETRKWTEAQNAPCAAVESCVGRISADKAALSSSQESETASQDFFTPPSTRRRKGKI
ncbi:hypothetical protein BKA66DRAFT_404080, partial [Pyrenochaeta sp. MPI-SDFR-AT-0127]